MSDLSVPIDDLGDGMGAVLIASALVMGLGLLAGKAGRYALARWSIYTLTCSALVGTVTALYLSYPLLQERYLYTREDGSAVYELFPQDAANLWILGLGLAILTGVLLFVSIVAWATTLDQPRRDTP